MNRSVRVPLIAGNWKMNLTISEGLALIESMRPALETIHDVEQVVCPSFVSLDAVHRALESSPIHVGAQNVHWLDRGAYTGEVSPPMIASLCRYVILGHSERRQYFGVTDDIVNRQIRGCIPHRLQPILCVGESLAEYEDGQSEKVVERQIRGGLHGLESCPGLVIAYEPIWAIGTGRAATGSGANLVIAAIRQVIGDVLGNQTALVTRILYGGSVTGVNIGEFINQDDIDGALVGGSSLKPHEFVAIVRAASSATPTDNSQLGR